jgi:hypothetical protein
VYAHVTTYSCVRQVGEEHIEANTTSGPDSGTQQYGAEQIAESVSSALESIATAAESQVTALASAVEDLEGKMFGDDQGWDAFK